MKKILLSAAAIFFLTHVYAQQINDSTVFKSRKLKVEEINFVSSYYNQNGDNASVTGGVGSEKLADIANVFDVRLIRYDKNQKKQSVDFELGIDHYTSASSDKVDLQANSSASHADTRFYSSANFSNENTTKGNSYGGGISFSTEYDYTSMGAQINFSKKTNNRSGEFTAKFQAFLDQLSLIAPIELRGAPNADDGGRASRKTFAGSFSFSQIISERLQVALLADIVQQQGYLSLPFHRVYFKDAKVHQEKLPDSRFKLPLAFRANYFLGDKFIIKTYYRFYKDDWDLVAHTFNIEVPYKVTPFISVIPFYRLYNQSAAKYFAPYQKHTSADLFYTSNYDLSKFNSQFYGAGIRLAPVHSVFSIQHFNMLEVRYAHYKRTTGLQANVISVNLKFK